VLVEARLLYKVTVVKPFNFKVGELKAMGITTDTEGPQSYNSPFLMRFSESEVFTEYSDSIDLIPEASSTVGGYESSFQRPPLSEEKYLIVSNDTVTQARVENILRVLFSSS
jgi:hypothetical protein